MSNLLKKLHTHIEKRGLLRAGDRVGVAVSGGADSVALLRLLLELRDQLGVVLSVVHFNHKLRGAASDKDEKFVASLAEQYGLTLHVGRGDVAKKAKGEKANLEDAARRARYAFFQKLTEGELVDCVATAHTADDQAETVLAHILRGTGLTGLGGIHPQTKDGIVRPLLSVRRGDLRRHLRAKKQVWREDLTNQDTSRQRARMRKKLLPLLEKEFNPKSVEHLGALANAAREDEAVIAGFVEILTPTLKAENGAIKIAARDVEWPFPLPVGEIANHGLGKRLVREAFGKLSSKSGQLTLRHVELVMELAKTGENGKVLQLPGGVDVRRDDDSLIFVTRSAQNGKKSAVRAFSYEARLSENETRIAAKEIGCVVRIRSIDWPGAGRETIKAGEAALDQEKMQGKLILRSLQPGDRMRPQGHQKAHKLKRLLNEKRVSRWDREGWPVLLSGKNIVWARGFVSADFAATDETRQAILISEEPA
ncbi:MAG TPA: tRNA lysidine(34) synthetase TilS [Candidatus Acidoferrum sp.]|nr:tRNA lysidine(34) synthetase TilS [Candidatus Acidoferrum sp.]